MSDFLFRKPPKTILTEKDKARINRSQNKIDPTEVEETIEVFDIPNYMKSSKEDEENWEQYKHKNIDEFLEENK
jgi:hypothetical protein